MNLRDAVFYQLYPLGSQGVLAGAPGERPLARVIAWADAMDAVGANTLWLGPVFASEHHGYDTTDYLSVDPRLGTNAELAALAEALRARGIALVLDVVLNHVARSHPFVRDVVENGAGSRYAAWIRGFDPSRRTGGLPFGYASWQGHTELVELDTSREEVRRYLVEVARSWIRDYHLAGFRLDAADRLDCGFLRLLARACREESREFFLLGESVHGETYRALLTEGDLDSVTNFEAQKALWSSQNDANYHEIAWTLDRLFGPHGLVRGSAMYSFADNHDVDRVASSVSDPASLYPLYGLLFAMPGVPSIYYGSEHGLEGKRAPHSDAALRPPRDPRARGPRPELALAIRRFADARRACRAVREGDYTQLHVEMQGLVFRRQLGGETAIIAVNGGGQERAFAVRADGFRDLLDDAYRPGASIDVPPHWLRWLVRQ